MYSRSGPSVLIFIVTAALMCTCISAMNDTDSMGKNMKTHDEIKMMCESDNNSMDCTMYESDMYCLDDGMKVKGLCKAIDAVCKEDKMVDDSMMKCKKSEDKKDMDDKPKSGSLSLMLSTQGAMGKILQICSLIFLAWVCAAHFI